MLEQKPRFVAEFCTFEVTRCPLKTKRFQDACEAKGMQRAHAMFGKFMFDGQACGQRVRTGLPSMSEPMSPSTPETKLFSTAMLSCSSCSLHGALGNKISNTIYV